MKAFTLSIFIMGITIWGSCNKKDSEINPTCLAEAKENLKKENSTFFKGSISKAELEDKSILIIQNNENGVEIIIDNLCTKIYSCCGYTCDCASPPWFNKIKNKKIIWEVN
jgi:hypothetical protein